MRMLFLAFTGSSSDRMALTPFFQTPSVRASTAPHPRLRGGCQCNLFLFEGSPQIEKTAQARESDMHTQTVPVVLGRNMHHLAMGHNTCPEAEVKSVLRGSSEEARFNFVKMYLIT